MSTQQQRKAKARARHEAYVQRQQSKTHKRKQRQVIVGAVAGILLVVAGGWFLWWSTSDDEPATTAESDTSDFTYSKAAETLPKGAPAELVLDTDAGPITITLDTTKAPQNSNSLAFLAGQGYFDETSCHRLTTEGIFVLQCGDRTGTGEGSPGYTTADENLPKADESGTASYPRASVAMAEPGGGEAGSQFFLVYKDTPLAPDYTIVGQITDGLDVVDGVAAAGVSPESPDPTDGAPAQPLTITAARVQQEGS